VVRVLVTLCLVFSVVFGTESVPAIGNEPSVSGTGTVLDAEPGDRLVNGPIAMVVPPPGRGVWGEAILDDGRTAVLGAETAPDGSVVVSSRGSPDQVGLLVLPTSPPDCQDDARSTLGFRWATTFDWFFNDRSTPAGKSKRRVESAIRGATRNITRSDNACSLADQVGATAEYGGRLRKGVQINTDGTCKGSGDGRSLTTFGQLPAGTLGIACVWFRGDGTATESDVRLNKSQSWVARVPDSCVGKWSIEAVTTHERGHTFGLGHVDEATHGNLTMSTQINGPCQKSEARLGRGDVRALRALY
jgi:hypothetical protein